MERMGRSLTSVAIPFDLVLCLDALIHQSDRIVGAQVELPEAHGDFADLSNEARAVGYRVDEARMIRDAGDDRVDIGWLVLTKPLESRPSQGRRSGWVRRRRIARAARATAPGRRTGRRPRRAVGWLFD